MESVNQRENFAAGQEGRTALREEAVNTGRFRSCIVLLTFSAPDPPRSLRLQHWKGLAGRAGELGVRRLSCGVPRGEREATRSRMTKAHMETRGAQRWVIGITAGAILLVGSMVSAALLTGVQIGLEPNRQYWAFTPAHVESAYVTFSDSSCEYRTFREWQMGPLTLWKQLKVRPEPDQTALQPN